MRPASFVAVLSLVALPLAAQSPRFPNSAKPANAANAGFTLEQVTSYPFPNELVAASSGGRIA